MGITLEKLKKIEFYFDSNTGCKNLTLGDFYKNKGGNHVVRFFEENNKDYKIKDDIDVLKSYYFDLDDLQLRLQQDYNGDVVFQQEEQDRLALGMVLDILDKIFEKV
jgi:hypothetical protein